MRGMGARAEKLASREVRIKRKSVSNQAGRRAVVYARALCAALVVLVSIAVAPASAEADSVTGWAEGTTPCPPDNNNFYCTGYAAGFCSFNAPYCTGYAAGHVGFGALIIALEEVDHGLEIYGHGVRRTFATDANDLIETLVGETFAQVERLTGLKAWVDVHYDGPSVGVGAQYGSFYLYERVSVPNVACIPPLCWPVFASGQNSDTAGDSVSNFVWNNSAIRIWDPGHECCRHTDGRAVWNLYTTSSKPRVDSDFWATSQKASVSPVNGKSLEGVLQWIGPAHEDTEELVDWSPISIDEYGSAGSVSLGAGLGMERFGGSASFSIGRTWNYSEGHVGATASHAGDHVAMWWRGSGGSTTFSRGVTGVETWKTPTDRDVSWLIGAEAHLD